MLQYRRDRLLVQRVRQTLASHAQQTHSAEALASLLNVSPRTLHRQLKEEGATLQGLKDEVRQGRAIELLHRTERPIKQVAEAAAVPTTHWRTFPSSPPTAGGREFACTMNCSCSYIALSFVPRNF